MQCNLDKQESTSLFPEDLLDCSKSYLHASLLTRNLDIAANELLLALLVIE